MEEPNGASKDKETVKVVVRCRPLFGKEIVEGRKPIVTIDPQASIISIKCPENDQVKAFTFDSVYDEHTSQRQFYDESGYPLVESIFEGYNGTIFAYGQTGCGKTHTMQGKDSPPELRGVIPHAFDHIFESINADPSREYMVRASYLEIYNEDIRDLLSDDSKKKLDLKESADGSVYVKELTEVVVSDVESINRVMNRGFKNRTVGATLMVLCLSRVVVLGGFLESLICDPAGCLQFAKNEGSSRSHSIFTVVVETSQKIAGEEHFKAGKEGCKINLSLSALGNVISALVDGKGKHIPYRDSKLTRLLQDSLGGNTKTLMVAAVSPADYNYDETLSTLRYANRAKNIKNKPIVNEDPKDAKLREYKEEIERLKKMLESQSRGNALGSASGMSTPRAMTPPASAGGNLTRERERSNTETLDQTLAKEREEIAKYQKEAAEMLQRAKVMMDEAKALQEEQQRSPLQQQDQQQLGSAEPSMRTSEQNVRPSSKDQNRVQAPNAPLDVPGDDASSSCSVGAAPLKPTPPAAAEATVSSAPPSGGGVMASLPPLITPRTKQKSRPDVLADLSLEKRDSFARHDESAHSSQSTSTPIVAAAAVSSSIAAVSTVETPASMRRRSTADEDERITKALGEAAKVDAQAKEMMRRAEQMMKDAEMRAKEAQEVKIIKEVVVKEVIPDRHVKEQEELKEFNQSILDQRDRMGKELEKTQQVMEAYMKEKQALHTKLQKIESQILGGTSNRKLVSSPEGGDGSSSKRPGGLVDSEVALLKQQVEYRRAQIKLKEKAKKEAQSEAARKALAIEKLQVEEELKTAQEAAQANLAAAKKKESKYRAKLDAARQEIVDLNNEFERERENLLDTIREQTKETKLMEQLVELFLPQNELVKVWERAVWVDEREEWSLPKLKPRSDFQKIRLPSLSVASSSGSGTTSRNGNSAAGGNKIIESGGAEVVSDEEAAASCTAASGPTTVRSSRSSSSSKRRKQSLKDSHHPNLLPKPTSSHEASLLTGRTDESGHSFSTSYSSGTTPSSSHPPIHSSRLISPENGRLPSAVRTSRYDPKDEAPIPEGISSHKSSKKSSSSCGSNGTTSSGTRERKRSKEHHKEKDRVTVAAEVMPSTPLFPTNNETRSPTGYTSSGEKFFPSEVDFSLAPLPSEYQPRDRLQSRKGSRQGARADASGVSSSTSQSSLNEFEYLPPTDKCTAGSSRSRNGHSGGSRHHHERSREHQEGGDGGCDGNDDWKDGFPVMESSLDASMTKKKSSKHKKKKERREKHGHGGGEATNGDLENAALDSHPYGYVARGGVPSPEDQDGDF